MNRQFSKEFCFCVLASLCFSSEHNSCCVVRITFNVAVDGGGHHSGHPVFRRCAAPEKKRAARTVGNNSG